MDAASAWMEVILHQFALMTLSVEVFRCNRTPCLQLLWIVLGYLLLGCSFTHILLKLAGLFLYQALLLKIVDADV